MANPTRMRFTFRAFAEDLPGERWAAQFRSFWPAYKRWFLRYGETERPTYFESVRALRRYLPGFMPVYEAMVEGAGGGDHAARFLAQFNPPPLFRGCSQAIYAADESVLVRSYDYSPYVFDGLVMKSRFTGRGVIAMLDGMSGVLDGINDDGFAVSLAFGGREEFGEGFGVTLVLRYLLEFAGDVDEACALLRRVPVQGAYNLLMLDRAGNYRLAILAPGEEVAFADARLSTNHQPGSHWPLYEEKVFTHERYRHLGELTGRGKDSAREFSRKFLEPPLYHTRFARGFGTLYDAAYYPERIACEYFWPELGWTCDFDDFPEREATIAFVDPGGYPADADAYAAAYTAKPFPALNY